MADDRLTVGQADALRGARALLDAAGLDTFDLQAYAVALEAAEQVPEYELPVDTVLDLLREAAAEDPTDAVNALYDRAAVIGPQMIVNWPAPADAGP